MIFYDFCICRLHGPRRLRYASSQDWVRKLSERLSEKPRLEKVSFLSPRVGKVVHERSGTVKPFFCLRQNQEKLSENTSLGNHSLVHTGTETKKAWRLLSSAAGPSLAGALGASRTVSQPLRGQPCRKDFNDRRRRNRK